MKRSFVAAALHLIERLSAEQRRRLADDPIAATGEMDIDVVSASPAYTSDKCSCDGAYFPEPYAPRPTILYVHTPYSRRECFTVLHELCHHLIRTDVAMLSDIADADGDLDIIEERICDAFAGRVLIPDDLVRAVLKDAQPQAAHLPALYDMCNASLEACAVRLAERMRCDGYVALLDTATHTLRFASASPQATYAWGRGTQIPLGHSAWRAVKSQPFNGEGEVVWASGQRRSMWLDAVSNGAVVCAVFAEDRYWGGKGLSILSDASITRAMPMAMSGRCAFCGANVWGTRACDKCGDVKCRTCGKCGCGAPAPAVRTCAKCHMTKGKAQFRAGSSECRDCEAA